MKIKKFNSIPIVIFFLFFILFQCDTAQTENPYKGKCIYLLSNSAIIDFYYLRNNTQ